MAVRQVPDPEDWDDPDWDPGGNDHDPPNGWPTPKQIRIGLEGAD